MSIIYLLIGCSIIIALGFLIAFLWSVRTGQYDDTETPAMRMLMDDIEVHKDAPSGSKSDKMSTVTSRGD